jgi:myo-inositol-1(or 4)-monophosphatase
MLKEDIAMTPKDQGQINLLTTIVKGAGEIIRSERMNFAVKEKSPGEIVTPADIRSNKFIVDQLKKSFPEYGFSSEEQGNEGSTSKRWIIDPLDGTTRFVWGESGYTVSIAQEVDGEVIFGVVYDPEHDEVFYAFKGHGAYRNGVQIHTSPLTDLSQAFVACDWGNSDDKRQEGLNYFHRLLLPKMAARRVVPQFAPANDLVRLAEGRIHALVCNDTWLEDHSAGFLIAREAGAIITNFSDRSKFDHQTPGIIAACTPEIWNSLNQLLEEFQKS